MDAELLSAAIVEAGAEGYDIASISGGEPLMYRGLVRLLDAARCAGMRTSLVTNGILLDEARLENLHPRLDFLAISLDGGPELHDRIRGSRGAFDRMAARLPGLRATGLPFGFVFTLSSASFDDLLWGLDFAVEQGAQLFQIHPLDETGRALVQLRGRAPAAGDSLAAWLAAQHLIVAYADRIAVRVDLIPAPTIPSLMPELMDESVADDRPLADAVSPLVIEDDGTIVPLEYGIDRRCALGSLHDARLSVLARRWLAAPTGHARLGAICREAYRRVCDNDVKILTWHQEIVREAADSLAR